MYSHVNTGKYLSQADLHLVSKQVEIEYRTSIVKWYRYQLLNGIFASTSVWRDSPFGGLFFFSPCEPGPTYFANLLYTARSLHLQRAVSGHFYFNSISQRKGPCLKTPTSPNCHLIFKTSPKNCRPTSNQDNFQARMPASSESFKILVKTVSLRARTVFALDQYILNYILVKFVRTISTIFTAIELKY